jgi:hypothetical protein
MAVCLFYLAEPKYGGWPTYTSHLYRGLAEIGKQPVLFKIGNRTDGRMRPFGRGIEYTNISIADAVSLAKGNKCFITAVGKGNYENACRLMLPGAAVCVHDPTELKEPFASALPAATTVVIRESMLAHVPGARFILHPYAPRGQQGDKKKLACAISRIDHDKNTAIIATANRTAKEPVELYGAVNRIYAHFTLDAKHPGWERHYIASPSANSLWACQKIACGYKKMVDLSVIKKDGQGTQYTFLEAVDAGCSLILHEEWSPTGLLAELSRTVRDADGLLRELPADVKLNKAAAAQLLAKHCHKQIARQTCEAIGA